MTIEKWEKDFKSFINELQILRDDYKNIMEYINEGVVLLKKQEQEIAFLKAMQLHTVNDMNESELGRIVGETLGFRIKRR